MPTKSGKRKRASAAGSANGDRNGVVAKGNGVAVKVENSDQETIMGSSQVEGFYDVDEESPSKRTKNLSVKNEDDDEGEADADADADGYADEGSDDRDEEFVV